MAKGKGKGYVRRSDNPGKKQCRIDPVSVGLYQGYSLIPYIFPMIMDVHVGLQDKRPISVMHDIYADDIVLCGTRREED